MKGSAKTNDVTLAKRGISLSAVVRLLSIKSEKYTVSARSDCVDSLRSRSR